MRLFKLTSCVLWSYTTLLLWRNTTVWEPGHAIKIRFFCVAVGTKDISNVRKRLVAGRDGSIRNSCWNYRPFLCSTSRSKRSSVPLSTTDNGNIGFVSGPVWLEESIQFLCLNIQTNYHKNIKSIFYLYNIYFLSKTKSINLLGMWRAWWHITRVHTIFVISSVHGINYFLAYFRLLSSGRG